MSDILRSKSSYGCNICPLKPPMMMYIFYFNFYILFFIRKIKSFFLFF
nr:MAG TPA: hypothetical protein [Caudoviricetes sp.]